MPATSIDLEFADGRYIFALKVPGINEMQEKCKAGIGRIYARVLAGRYIIDMESIGNPVEAEYMLTDLTETIRQGLIGGGMGVVDGEEVKVNSITANRLVENYVVGRPLSEGWALAASVLMALIEGYDPPKKKVEPEAPTSKGGSITPDA